MLLIREPSSEEKVTHSGTDGDQQRDGTANGDRSGRKLRNRFDRSDTEKRHNGDHPPAAQVGDQDPADPAVVREGQLAPIVDPREASLKSAPGSKYRRSSCRAGSPARTSDVRSSSASICVGS